MALSREQKEKLLTEYGERLGQAQVMIWAKYTALTVAQVQDLRHQLREVEAEGVVVKNTLMRMALENANLPTDPEMMVGPCLVTFAYGDIAAAAKAVASFARANEDEFEIAGGIVDGVLVSKDRIRDLTTLPSREELLARVFAGMQAPISGFVGTLAAVMRGLMNVLNARSEQLEGSAG